MILIAIELAVAGILFTFACCFVLSIFDDEVGWAFANTLTSSISVALCYGCSFALIFYSKYLNERKLDDLFMLTVVFSQTAFLVGVCTVLPFVSMIAGITSTSLATFFILVIFWFSTKVDETKGIVEFLKRNRVLLLNLSVTFHAMTILYFFFIFGSKVEPQFETFQLVMVLVSSAYAYFAIFFLANSFIEDEKAGFHRGVVSLYLELARLYFWFLMIGKRK